MLPLSIAILARLLQTQVDLNCWSWTVNLPYCMFNKQHGDRSLVSYLTMYYSVSNEISPFLSNYISTYKKGQNQGQFILYELQNCHIYLSIYLSMALQPLCWALSDFSVSWSLYTVGRTPWTGDQPVARPLPAHRTAQTQNKGTQTSMP
jgi:hypothetical protein